MQSSSSSTPGPVEGSPKKVVRSQHICEQRICLNFRPANARLGDAYTITRVIPATMLITDDCGYLPLGRIRPYHVSLTKLLDWLNQFDTVTIDTETDLVLVGLQQHLPLEKHSFMVIDGEHAFAEAISAVSRYFYTGKIRYLMVDIFQPRPEVPLLVLSSRGLILQEPYAMPAENLSTPVEAIAEEKWGLSSGERGVNAEGKNAEGKE